MGICLKKLHENRDTWTGRLTGPQYEWLLSIYQDWTRYVWGNLLHHWIYLIAFSARLGYILFRLVSVACFLSIWMIPLVSTWSVWETICDAKLDLVGRGGGECFQKSNILGWGYFWVQKWNFLSRTWKLQIWSAQNSPLPLPRIRTWA